MNWRCPHCNHATWSFKRDKTAPGKHRTYACPSCGGRLRRVFNWKLAALLFPAAVIVDYVVGMQLHAAGLGDYSSIFTGLMVATVYILSNRLERIAAQ